MSKLSLDNLAKGIVFHEPESSEVLISFTSDDSHTVSNFISKYEEHINMTILRHESDGFVSTLKHHRERKLPVFVI